MVPLDGGTGGSISCVRTENTEFVADVVAKIESGRLVAGWFYSPDEKLVDVYFTRIDRRAQVSEVGLDHGGVRETIGPGLGFRVQAVTPVEFSWNESVTFVTSSGREIIEAVEALAKDRISRYRSLALTEEFYAEINSDPNHSVLDIGGRDRSRFDLSKEFAVKEFTVVDIIDGANVDIVGDAHELSSFLPSDHFDFVLSNAVFEHLLMPWKVAIEMNRVMRVGARALISTHQTIGMHDLPWDFWRFSDTAWDAIFNKYTGFRILDRVLDFEQFVIPFVIRPGKLDAEKSAGFEASVVLVEKVDLPVVDWDVSLPDITSTRYPTTDDGQRALDRKPILQRVRDKWIARI